MELKMSLAEFVELMQSKALAQFLNMSVPSVEALEDAQRQYYLQQMRDYNAHMETLAQGIRSTKEQGFQEQDYLQMIMNMVAEEKNA